MNIPAKEVKERKKIGHIGARTVYGIAVVGGLHLVAATKSEGQGLEVLGAGSHPGVARHIAKQRHAVVYDALAKSEEVDPRHYGDLLPAGEAYTEQLRKAQGY